MAMHVSVKRLQIDKANTTIVVAVGIAAFALTFSLVAARSLLSKQSYQNKVIEAREQARDQLESNIAAVDELKVKYTEFVSRQENIIKGNSNGNGERDGDNARIVLDALPSKYDFPALASSLEKILVDRNYVIRSINGTDDEVNQNPSASGAAPAQTTQTTTTTQTTPAAPAPTVGTAVEMPFELSAEGSYQGMLDLLGVFKNSIRPMYIQSISFSAGEGANVQLTVQGRSYYQPERTLNIREEVVQ
jgi:hypothetical protein